MDAGADLPFFGSAPFFVKFLPKSSENLQIIHFFLTKTFF